jgi:hypothetical protein
LTDNWRSLAVKDGVVLVPTEGFDILAEEARKRGWSYADLLVFMSLNFEFAGGAGERGVLDEKLIQASRRVAIRATAYEDADDDDGDGEDGRMAQEELEEERREWSQATSMPFLGRQEAPVYRGIAKETGLENAVCPWDEWPSRIERKGK